MPVGTKVHKCVDKVKKNHPIGNAIAICQASTHQGYATGRMLTHHPKRVKKHKG